MNHPDTSVQRIVGSGEMADAIRSRSWSETPLGPISSWSETLVSTVNLILCLPFPANLTWGPTLALIYNDAYRPFLAHKHPASLGQSMRAVFQEAWPLVGAQYEAALTYGHTEFQTNVLVPIEKDGVLEDVFWLYSLSPVHELGRIGGVLNVCQNITEQIVAERRLRASESRANRILESIGDAVVVTDEETRVTGMNAVAEDLTGWAFGDAEGRPLAEVFDIISEDTRQVVESPADKVKRLGTVVGLANHTILRRRDASELHIDDSGAPILDDSGQLTGIVLVFRDIGEKRRMERERERLLLESKARFAELEATYNTAAIAMALIDAEEFRYLRVNDRLSDILGMPREEIVGSKVSDTAQDVAGLMEALEKVRGGVPVIGGILEGEISTMPGVRRFWTMDYHPVLAPDGSVKAIAAASLEITEMKHAEENLRLSEERLRLALSAANGVGTWDWDIPNDRVYANESFASAYSVDPGQAAKGVPLAEFTRSIHPDDFDRVGAQIAEAMQTGEEFTSEYRLVHPDGAVRWVSAQGRCTLAEDGEPLRFPGVTVDITDRKLTENALRQNEKLAAVGRLASSIAHEINNPLESVTNLLYLARNSENLADIQGYLKTAERELRRVSVISNQTLRFHKQSTNPRAVTATDLLETVLSIYHGRFVNSHVVVEERDRSTQAVLCFDGEIRQVLNNLVSNAIDAMPSGGGRLVIHASNSTHWKTGEHGLRITIADTGSGIPRETQRRIFEPFFTTKGIGGTGLGLWVSQEIVQRHGGTLTLRSSQRPEASGTVFTLFLPFDAVKR